MYHSHWSSTIFLFLKKVYVSEGWGKKLRVKKGVLFALRDVNNGNQEELQT